MTGTCRATKLVIIAVILAVFAVFLDWSLISGIGLTLCSQLLSSASITTTIQSASISLLAGPAITLSGINVYGASLLSSLLIDSATIRCNPNALWSSGQCKVTASVYDGNLDADLSLEGRRMLSMSGKLKDLSIAAHPLVRGLGIEQGVLSISNFSLENDSRILKALVNLSDLEKPLATKLSPSMSGLPFAVEIPALSIKSAEVLVSQNAASVHLNMIILESSLGTLRGEAQGNIKGTKFQLDKAHLTLDQSATGRIALRPYLQFICDGNALNSDRVTLQLNGSAFSCRAN